MSFTPVSHAVLQRQCACGTHTMGGGQCAECQKKKMSVGGRPLLTKLAISEPSDVYEQEADRVAEQVMRMSPVDMGMGKWQKSGMTQPLVQRQASSGATGLAEAPLAVHEVLNSPGHPLDAAARAFFEPRFGHDLSQVRVHAGERAERSARDVGAHAYTVGEDIVFGRGQWAPETTAGRRLLAHELAHLSQEESASTIRRDIIYRQPDKEQIAAEIQILQMQLRMPVNPLASMQQVRLIQLQAMLKGTGGGKPSHPKPLLDLPFAVRFSKAWDQAREAALQEVRKNDKDRGSSITRGLIEVKDLAPSHRDVWKTGVYGGLFKNDEKDLVDVQSAEMARQTYSKRYKAAKFGHIYGEQYESSGLRRDDDTEIWSRGRRYGLFLPSEKAAVLNISAIGIARAATLNSMAQNIDPKGPQAWPLMDEIHNFTKDPAIVLLGPEIERLFGSYGYEYRDEPNRWFVADAINKAYEKSLQGGQILKDPDASLANRWDECQRRRSLGKNNLEGAAFDPVCFKSEDEFQQELIRRDQEFRTRYQACGKSRPSHFKCRDEVAAEYFPTGQARQDAIRRWAYGEMEIYEGVRNAGVVSQTGFYIGQDVLGWSTERSAAFGGALSTGTSLGLGYVHRRALLQKPQPNPPPTVPTVPSGERATVAKGGGRISPVDRGKGARPYYMRDPKDSRNKGRGYGNPSEMGEKRANPKSPKRGAGTKGEEEKVVLETRAKPTVGKALRAPEVIDQELVRITPTGPVYKSAPAIGVDPYLNYITARDSAIRSVGLGNAKVPHFVESVGSGNAHLVGRMNGYMSSDGSRGWRLDYDPKKGGKGLHINWWRTEYGIVHNGAISINGDEATFFRLLQGHFGIPPH